MPPAYKVVVTGPFNAGKTRFIKTISEIEVVSTERRLTPARPRQPAHPKTRTTVAMDYGRLTLEQATLHLHGTPGQARFDFMWDILSREMAGFVLVVDASAPDSFDEARELVEAFTTPRAVPFVVAANKQDLPGAAAPARLQRALRLGPQVLILPCVASRKTSVRQVLVQLADLL